MSEVFTLPATLYHGTRSSVLQGIATRGLVPRALGGTSNWSHSVESRADAVYLTVAYGLYYSKACTAAGVPTILEIDSAKLAAHLFASDEDGVAPLEEGRKEAGSGTSLEEATRYWRDRIHDVHPSTSLATIGSCTYFGVIPATAIRRVLVLSNEESLRLTLQACDPVITPMNFRFFGAEFKALSRWLFDPTGPCPSSRFPVEPPAWRPVSLTQALKLTRQIETA